MSAQAATVDRVQLDRPAPTPPVGAEYRRHTLTCLANGGRCRPGDPC